MADVIAALVAVGPIIAILALLTKTIRRRLGYGVKTPPIQWPGRGGPRGAGDRSPHRPRVPSLSGGAALIEPHGEELELEDAGGARYAAVGRPNEGRRAAS